MAAKNVTVIPATVNPITRLPHDAVKKRRVAGYARVSTDSEEQLTSYEAQVDYYTQYIQSNPNWQFVGVYTDEGISAVNTKKREGFNRMVQDALAGRIDLIVTKLELARRKTSGRQTHCTSPFSGKILCGDCGEFYGSKVWHSTSKYRRTIWQCNAKFHNEEKCKTPHIYEDDLKRHFITALSELLTDRTTLLEDGRLLRKELLDFRGIDAEQKSISQELSIIAELIRKQITENAAREQSQTAYMEQYDSLTERYEALQAQIDALQKQKEQREIQADAISGCLFALGELDLLQVQFSEELWNATVERVTVFADERLVFRFKNGVEVTVEM